MSYAVYVRKCPVANMSLITWPYLRIDDRKSGFFTTEANYPLSDLRGTQPGSLYDGSDTRYYEMDDTAPC